MPRKSFRQEVLEELEELYMKRQVKNLLDLVSDRQPEDGDSLDEIMGLAIEAGYEEVLNRRYIDRPPYRTGYKQGIFERDLNEDETGEQLPWLSEEARY